MKSSSPGFLSIWIYLGEIIATSLIYFFIFLTLESTVISSFVIKTSSNFLSKFSFVMLTASIGFFWTFYKQSDGEFSKWLYKKNAYNTYIAAFVSSIAIYLITSLLLLATEISSNNLVAWVTGWFLILAIINVFTFFANIISFMRLRTFFSIKLEEYKKDKNIG